MFPFAVPLDLDSSKRSILRLGGVRGYVGSGPAAQSGVLGTPGSSESPATDKQRARTGMDRQKEVFFSPLTSQKGAPSRWLGDWDVCRTKCPK